MYIELCDSKRASSACTTDTTLGSTADLWSMPSSYRPVLDAGEVNQKWPLLPSNEQQHICSAELELSDEDDYSVFHLPPFNYNDDYSVFDMPPFDYKVSQIG